MSKEDSNTFYAAAEVMYDGRDAPTGCCYAIHCIEHEGYSTPLQHRFQEVFAPNGWHQGNYWFGFSPEEQKIRVLALLFAAAMAAEGDL